MSNVHRLRTTDRIFYVTVNLRRSVQSFDAPEYRTMIEVMEGSRARSKVARSKLITCGYRRDIADKNPTVRTTLTVATRSVRIQHSGAPGSVIAQVASVDESQDLVVDARTANELDGWAGSGANPWHVDSQTDSVLFLTDEGDKPARIGFSITAGGTHYYLTSLRLAPGETRAINIRELRDAQAADFQGNKIPAGAADGSANWVRLDSVPVEGRLIVIQKRLGVASNYDCSTCYCPAVFTALAVAPGSFGLIPTAYENMGSTATYHSCNTGNYYYDVTAGSSWSSNNTPVIQMDGTVHYRADAKSAGTANVSGGYTDCFQFDTNPDLDCPCITYHTYTASGAGTVQVPARLVHHDYSPCAPGGVGPLQILTNNSVVDCSGTTHATNVCGVNRNLIYQLEDTTGSPFALAYTIQEHFSNFGSTNSALKQPTALSASVPAGGLTGDYQWAGFTYPTCLGSNDHSSYTQTWTVTVGGTQYNLSTVVSISLGKFNGTAEDNVNITTP